MFIKKTKIHIIKKKLNTFNSNEFLLLWFGTLCLLIFFWIIGFKRDYNLAVLLVYISFLVVIFIRDVTFIAELSWSLILFGMNVLGVYVCEETDLYLIEQQLNTKYVNALTPLICCYVIFFGVIEFLRLQNQEHINMGIKRCVELKEYDTNQNNEKYSKMLTIIGIVLIIILFSKVVNKPYFVLKMTRLVYAQNLSKWENSLKWYLPLFIPVAVRCGKDGHKLLKNSFIIFLTIYYFWVGDKFGTYFFAVYIILICNIEDSSKKTIGKLAIVMLIAVFALLGVVYIQNILLYNSTFSAYLDMVFARLSNQGGVWWGTYIRYKNCTPKIGEFIEELKSILPLSNINTYSVGQWKMMLVSSGFSAYAQYRIDIVNPYTATTTASCFYYFGMIITLVLYVIIGVIYGRYIHYMREICSSGNLIESMIAVKILIHLHAMLTGSNLYLISYKGLLYVLLALFFAKCRKMNKHIVIGRFYIA